MYFYLLLSLLCYTRKVALSKPQLIQVLFSSDLIECLYGFILAVSVFL